MSERMKRIRETEEYKRHAEEMNRLIDEYGLAEAVRISAERDHELGLSKGRDYTKERRKLLRGMSIDDWMRDAFPDYQPQKPSDEHGEQPTLHEYAHRQLMACWARLAPRLLETH